jgi:hypothetical protein
MDLEVIERIPAGLELSQWSAREFALTTPTMRDLLEKQSRSMWVSYGWGRQQIAVLGVHVPRAGPPELWTLLLRDFRTHLRSNLPILKSHAQFIMDAYPTLVVRIDGEAPAGRHFVEYMGFRLKREEQHPNGQDYFVYEVSR